MSKTQIGLCKLCLRTRELQNSHLMPRALYKYVREPKKSKPDPILVSRTVTGRVSRQIKDYVLCKDCEDRFNRNGENYVLRQVWNGQTFPLRDRLTVAMERHTLSEALAYSGTDVGVDTDKLGYFALSVAWRAAVHTWKAQFGESSTAVNLGQFQEPIRQYLLGVAAFPPGVNVVVHICSDRNSKECFYAPTPISGVPCTGFVMLALGIHFVVVIGSGVPREICCVNSSHRLIFKRDCSQKLEEAFAQLIPNSRLTKGMAEDV